MYDERPRTVTRAALTLIFADQGVEAMSLIREQNDFVMHSLFLVLTKLHAIRSENPQMTTNCHRGFRPQLYSPDRLLLDDEYRNMINANALRNGIAIPPTHVVAMDIAGKVFDPTPGNENYTSLEQYKDVLRVIGVTKK